MDDRRLLWATVGVLAVVDVGRATGLLGPPPVSAAVITAAMVLVARAAGLSRVELGLERRAVRAGLRDGLAAAGVVLAVLAVVALVPATRGALDDTRAHVSGARLLRDEVVAILLVTVVPEELAFRGVLLALSRRVWTDRRAVLAGALLFGLWHVPPTLHTMHGNAAVGGVAGSIAGRVLVVAGAVAATAAAGAVFCLLRLHSHSLLAPVVAHVATNGLGLAVAWAVWRH